MELISSSALEAKPPGMHFCSDLSESSRVIDREAGDTILSSDVGYQREPLILCAKQVNPEDGPVPLELPEDFQSVLSPNGLCFFHGI